MKVEARFSQLVNAFLKEITEVPNDLFVPKYQRWVGLEPMEQVHYTVKYHTDAASVLQRAAGRDQFLYPLQRRLKFRLDEKNRELHVHLIPVTEFSC